MSKAGELKMTVKPTLKTMKKKLDRRIDQISGSGGGLGGGGMVVPNKKAAIFLDQWLQKNFQTEGGKVGGWKSISRSGKILQDTGRLRISFLPFATAKDAGIGSDLPYSAVHDKGLGGMPQRQILPRHDDVDTDLFKIYDQHVAVLTRKPL